MLVMMTDNCWLYAGYISPKGYGIISYWSKELKKVVNELAHRSMYENTYGLIRGKYVIDHLCRNRACINPVHLEPVSNKENILRGIGPTAINKAKTHCIKGHLFTENNTYTNRGRRQCRKCGVERTMKYYRKVKTNE